MWKKALVAALLATAALAPRADAQLLEDYRFKGKVVDPSGNPLEGVQITFRETKNGARTSFTSKADGTFDRRMIQHAVYDVTFEKTGYVTYKDRYDWSVSPEKPVEKTATVTLASEAENAKKELGKKAAKLYEDAYSSLTSGDCAAARKNANELLEIGAGAYEYAVRFVLARCHAMAKEWDPAAVEYRKVIDGKPDLYEAHFDLAGVLTEKGDMDGAVAAYARALELKPEDSDAHYNLGAILFKQGKYEEATPHMQKTVELDPRNAQAHKAIGFASLQAKTPDMAAAAEHLKKYLELEPQASDAASVQDIVKGAEAALAPKGGSTKGK